MKDLPINDLFLCFSSVGLLFNIYAALKNISVAMPAESRNLSSLVKPLTRLSPFIAQTLAMLGWIHARERLLLRTTLFIPLALFWGIASAHHVQLVILAHLTKSPFPSALYHPLVVLTVLAALDARFKVFQTTDERVKQAVLGCLAIAFLVYSHFVWEVIGDICRFYDIKCVSLSSLSRESLTVARMLILMAASLHSCLTIKRKPPPGSAGHHDSPAEIAQAHGKGKAPVREKNTPVAIDADPTGVKQPTAAGTLKRAKAQ